MPCSTGPAPRCPRPSPRTPTERTGRPATRREADCYTPCNAPALVSPGLRALGRGGAGLRGGLDAPADAVARARRGGGEHRARSVHGRLGDRGGRGRSGERPPVARPRHARLRRSRGGHRRAGAGHARGTGGDGAAPRPRLCGRRRRRGFPAAAPADERPARGPAGRGHGCHVPRRGPLVRAGRGGRHARRGCVVRGQHGRRGCWRPRGRIRPAANARAAGNDLDGRGAEPLRGGRGVATGQCARARHQRARDTCPISGARPSSRQVRSRGGGQSKPCPRGAAVARRTRHGHLRLSLPRSPDRVVAPAGAGPRTDHLRLQPRGRHLHRRAGHRRHWQGGGWRCARATR